MSWKEAKTGLYERPLGGVEKPLAFFIAAERPEPREPIQIRAIADVTISVAPDKVVKAFREAWKAARLLKSPDIATTFGDGYKRYQIPSPDELEAWLDETYRVAQLGVSKYEVIKDMQRRIDWLPVCYIIPQPTEDGTFKGTVIVFISHWRTEASGALRVINQMLDYVTDLLHGTSTREALSNHTSGSEIPLLTPALEDILLPNQKSTPEAQTRVAKLFADYASHLPSIDFPSKGNLSAPPTDNNVIQRIYTPASTASLISACKAKDISVTAAVHSAYLGAVWHVAPPEKRNRSYASMMPAEVRKRLPSSSLFRDQGCWNAAQMLLLTVPSGQDFLTRARSLRQQYALASQETWLHEDMLEMNEQTIEFSANTPPELQVTVMPWFTSLGVLDGDVIVSDHGVAKVENVTGWADNLGPGIVLTMWTFRGRLNIQISWNASFQDEGLIQETMDLIEKILVQELGIEMDTEEVRRLAEQ
jgi:hypothetical protein